jgi:hypothetical protein
MNTTTNTVAASLSDEQKKQIAAVVHRDCALIPGANFYTAAELAIQATLAQISRATPSPQADAAPSVTLNGAQLLEALEFVAPDYPRDAEQLECEVTIQRGNGHDGPGLYCWITEYPDEGAIRLDAAPAAANGEQ